MWGFRRHAHHFTCPSPSSPSPRVLLASFSILTDVETEELEAMAAKWWSYNQIFFLILCWFLPAESSCLGAGGLGMWGRGALWVWGLGMLIPPPLTPTHTYTLGSLSPDYIMETAFFFRSKRWLNTNCCDKPRCNNQVLFCVNQFQIFNRNEFRDCP